MGQFKKLQKSFSFCKPEISAFFYSIIITH